MMFRLTGIGSVTCTVCVDPLEIDFAAGPIPDSVAVQVRDARVIMHGEVESASQQGAAESAVRQLTGVRVVDNLIKVKPQTESTADDVERRGAENGGSMRADV